MIEKLRMENEDYNSWHTNLYYFLEAKNFVKKYSYTGKLCLEKIITQLLEEIEHQKRIRKQFKNIQKYNSHEVTEIEKNNEKYNNVIKELIKNYRKFDKKSKSILINHINNYPSKTIFHIFKKIKENTNLEPEVPENEKEKYDAEEIESLSSSEDDNRRG